MAVKFRRGADRPERQRHAGRQYEREARKHEGVTDDRASTPPVLGLVGIDPDARDKTVHDDGHAQGGARGCRQDRDRRDPEQRRAKAERDGSRHVERQPHAERNRCGDARVRNCDERAGEASTLGRVAVDAGAGCRAREDEQHVREETSDDREEPGPQRDAPQPTPFGASPRFPHARNARGRRAKHQTARAGWASKLGWNETSEAA
ncbi:hypothetical protein ACFPRL_19765 [Pseudoclavibacter helvolus]